MPPRPPPRACPALEPHPLLYEWLLDHDRPQPRGCQDDWPTAGLAWLGPELAAKVVDRLGDAHWLAQEWVGLDLLRSWPGWTSPAT